MPRSIRVGLIGAGYIATWHGDALAATEGVQVTAVCDLSETAAKNLAASHDAQVFTSIDALIDADICDAVHILTPPDHHHAIAVQCLQGGLHVLVEKPVAESGDQTRAIADVADKAGKRFAAGHNFLGLPAYMRMKQEADAGVYGRISSAEITWALPLAPLRSGPYNLWLLRRPQNLLLELAPHLVAFAHDLFGPVKVRYAEALKPIALPGEDMRPQGFRILAQAGHVDLTISLSMVEVIDDRSVTLRGSSARARLNYANDTLNVEHDNASDLVLNPLRRQLDLARQHRREGFSNAWTQLTSLNTRNPYGQSFRGMMAGIYGPMAKDKTPDPRFSAKSAIAVMETIGSAIDALPPQTLEVASPAVQTRTPKPTAMVIGGTGFIGRALTRRLVADGRDVRVLSRGRSGPFPDLTDQVETVAVSLHDRVGLTEAMKGMDVVYNLAKALETTWDGALRSDVGVATRIAKASMDAGVKRLIYTGTIASYDMSDPSRKITEDTGFAADMTDRNLYARSKAECEKQLMGLHRERGLPVVIARPGIVVGHGGPLQHWGIGRWHGAGAVRIWGHGDNILPFVLNDDIADGLVRMIDPPIDGQSFNLVGDRLLSARGYFKAIDKRLGAKICVVPGNLHAFYAADAVKWGLKRYALGNKSAVRPSLADWKSRAHFSPFLNDKPKQKLGWQPAASRDTFLDKAISEADLFGF